MLPFVKRKDCCMPSKLQWGFWSIITKSWILTKKGTLSKCPFSQYLDSKGNNYKGCTNLTVVSDIEADPRINAGSNIFSNIRY